MANKKSTTDELVSRYKIECSVCGRSWRDKRRDNLIEKALKKDPDYLKNYVCRKCKKLNKTRKKRDTNADNIVKGQLTKEDLKQFIPKKAEKYFNRNLYGVKDEKVLQFHLGSNNPLLKNVLFIGETGTGKTALLQHFCWKNEIPYYRMVMNAGTTTEDIIGQWTMGKDGQFSFHYQVLILFMKYGGIFVFDEINAGQKDILHILNSITDWERRAIVTQHKGEIIEAIPEFLTVACMNPPQEYDLQEMSKSLKSRFTPYYFDYDDKIDRKVLGDDKNLLEFAKSIRLARANGEIETPLSTRDLKMFQLVREGLGYEVAKGMLISKFNNGEKSAVKTQMEVLLEKSKILDKGDEDEK